MQVFINHDGGAKLQILLRDMERRMRTAYAHAGTFDPASAEHGAVNEFGDPGHNVPARPFMGTTFKMRYRAWLNIIIAELKKRGARSTDALKVAGLAAATDICQTLSSAPSLFQANAPRTVKKKGFDYPLLETGKLFKSIRYRITGGPL